MVTTANPANFPNAWLRRHPVVADSLCWAVPALLVGGMLRVLMSWYLPYGFWGADSRSFYAFAHKLIETGAVSMGEKRRFLYPLLMVPISFLPGGALRWLPVFQHTLGWLTLVPLAYAVRKCLSCWKVWIIPITVVYSGIPIVLWDEHELLGHHLFFALYLWTFAGWIAWATQTDRARSRCLFWALFIPFALLTLTKPSARFLWPGLVLGFVWVKAWRLLGWRQAVALLLVLAISPAVGSKKQGAWMLYQATFPLTRLDTPLHAEYKADIREAVERYRRELPYYHTLQDGEPFHYLRDPGEQEAWPIFRNNLGRDEKLRIKIYEDLAMEGVKARPDLFLYLAVQRVVLDANLSAYAPDHFEDGGFVSRMGLYYTEAEEDEKSPVRLALGLPRQGALLPYETFQHLLEPAPGSWPARTVQGCLALYGDRLDFLRYPRVPRVQILISQVRPTLLGWWMALALLCSFLGPYRNTLGVWTIITLVYLLGVYLVSLVNAQYFAPAWPVFFTIMPVPLDFLLARLFAGKSASPTPATLP